MRFAYEAMSASGRLVRDTVEARSVAEAADGLRGQGLMPLKLSQTADVAARRRDGMFSRGFSAGRELVLFSRQMKMLLESGASVVPALEAIEQQSQKPAFRRVVRKVREEVEGGGTLADALQQEPRVFKPIFRSMVAAGEATGTLPATFARLSDLAVQQAVVRKRVIGALAYPGFLSLLCLAVIGVVLGFVVPRFKLLFASVRSPLPASTEWMLAISDFLIAYWPYVLLGSGVVLVSAIMIIRLPALRLRVDRATLQLPLVGRVVARLAIGQVLRIWAAMLRSHVSLMDTIEHSRSATSNEVVRQLIDDVEESVASGGHVGQTLGASSFVEPVVASAIRTGEDNGRLAESVEFVSNWLDDDNQQLITNLTRVLEPALLSIMGLVVGVVAMSLFLPLFDMAAAGG